MMKRFSLISGAIFGLLGVAFGAFGAHALKPMLLQSGRLDTFELAVRYQFYHAFALLVVGLLMNLYPSRSFGYSSICFLIGIIFFSGSLYALSFTGIGVLGAITPIGGFLLIIGWSFLLLGIWNMKKAP
jgi:uncharacterized membrane protein YgdD (TMEM256/DUF423 family)